MIHSRMGSEMDSSYNDESIETECIAKGGIARDHSSTSR